MESTLYFRARAKEGVELHYDNNIHAKLVTVDKTVAIISSMNFYAGSSAGKIWEAGIVTLEEKIVDEVNKSILKQID